MDSITKRRTDERTRRTAALVVVISAVVAFGSRDEHPEAPRSQPPSIARMSALAVSDLPAGWKAEPFVQNAPGSCLPSFTNTAVEQVALQFDGPSGETLQEIVAYEPDDAHEEFDLASRAMLRCSSKPTDLPAIGDESGAYFVAPVRAPTASSGDANVDAAVALVRLGDLRIDVIVFRRDGIDEHILEPLVRASVRKSVATQALKLCGLGDLAFDCYGGGGATGNDFGTIRIRNTNDPAVSAEGVDWHRGDRPQRKGGLTDPHVSGRHGARPHRARGAGYRRAGTRAG